MKNIIYTKLIAILLLIFALQIFSASNKRDESVEFQLRGSRASLAPKHRRAQSIRKKINSNSVEIDFGDWNKGNEVELKPELTGADCKRCIEKIRDIGLAKKQTQNGLSTFDVAQADRAGKNKISSSSAAQTSFARKIEQVAAVKFLQFAFVTLS